MSEKPLRGRGPAPKYGSKSIVKSVRMPAELWENLGILADRWETSRNEIIVRTLLRKTHRDI